jgi:DNA-binding MarR family transcriptional regulator
MTAALSPSQQLTRRLRDGLDRICVVMRADQWAIAGAVGLNPTQTHVLTFITGRGEKGVRVGAIATQLGVAQPTATDSIASLVRKGFLTKAPDPEDTRAVTVRVTRVGRDIVRGIGLAITATERALETLSIREQTELLRLVIKTIRALQVAGAIAPQRMCVTCGYFRPNAHEDKRAPHHCAYVDAAFGAEGLRIDCDEHEALPEADREAVWISYMKAFSDSEEDARDVTR